MNRDPIIEKLNEITGVLPVAELPDPERTEAIRALATRSLAPVRPLPSNGALTLLTFLSFVVFVGAAAMALGFGGYHHLSLPQKLAYYGVILLAAAALSGTVVKEIIPGSKHRVSPLVAPVLAVTAVGLVALALFPRLDFARFAQIGLPCLKLGTECAAASGVLAYVLILKGFSTSPVRAATIAGSLAGLAGFAVLALRCPVHNIAHIAVWHMGAVLIAGGAAAMIALLASVRRSPRRDSESARLRD